MRVYFETIYLPILKLEIGVPIRLYERENISLLAYGKLDRS